MDNGILKMMYPDSELAARVAKDSGITVSKCTVERVKQVTRQAAQQATEGKRKCIEGSDEEVERRRKDKGKGKCIEGSDEEVERRRKDKGKGKCIEGSDEEVERRRKK